jgi:hypothetical protein
VLQAIQHLVIKFLDCSLVLVLSLVSTTISALLPGIGVDDYIVQYVVMAAMVWGMPSLFEGYVNSFRMTIMNVCWI